MNFPDQIKERKLLLADSQQRVIDELGYLTDDYEHRINELESDLENEQGNNTDLHDKLEEVRGKRDEYRELLRETFDAFGITVLLLRQRLGEKDICNLHHCDQMSEFLTKAKEVMS